MRLPWSSSMPWLVLAFAVASAVATNTTQPWGGSPCYKPFELTKEEKKQQKQQQQGWMSLMSSPPSPNAVFCRPSFVIIGVGKCGTSSLYYYLASHPSVKKASTKQLEWFDHRYAQAKFVTSYLKSFPKLKDGEMSGESSPGYIAYPIVSQRVANHLSMREAGLLKSSGGTRFLAIARDPGRRAFSSYNYNYLTVAKDTPISFHTLVLAEMAFLRRCFRGDAKRDECKEAPHLCRHDLSGTCYNAHSKEDQVGAEAAKELGPNFRSSLPRGNAHLWRQIVGRSLYSTYLEWWYDVFEPSEIRLVCLEDLSESAASVEMDSISQFLGLKSFDYSKVLKGKFNAGDSHAGYGKVTPWGATPAGKKSRPRPDAATLAAIAEFAEPFNERLFQLAGHRCPWQKTDNSSSPDGARKGSRRRGRRRR